MSERLNRLANKSSLEERPQSQSLHSNDDKSGDLIASRESIHLETHETTDSLEHDKCPTHLERSNNDCSNNDKEKEVKIGEKEVVDMLDSLSSQEGSKQDGGQDVIEEHEPDNMDSDEMVELHKELDGELLATNQKILNLLKKLDSMPSHLEIDQYQKRYIELHQQLITKNKDLKKLYVLANSLDSTKHYLTKEINLLDSIHANLDLTNNSPTNRFEFLKQFRQIITKIQSVRNDAVSKLDDVKGTCIALDAEYTKLLE